MSSLTDYVDRLSSLASSIRTSASAAGRSTDNVSLPSSSAGPFTRAVLETPLGDLIRDIDPSEIGLFTIVQPSTHTTAQTTEEDAPVQKAEIARVTFPVATPLRKPPSTMHPRRDDGQKPGEYEPEVYANAALKFLDRYQSIRHMPRYSEQAERIVAQLAAVRDSIASLNEQLKQASSTLASDSQLSPKSKVKEEERRIEAAQAKINELRKQKETLLHKQQRIPSKPTSHPKPKPAPQSPAPPDAQEETFWNTPGAAPRTLHFTGELLTDEQIDIGDLSALSSPVPEQVPVRAVARNIHRAAPSRGRALQFTRKTRDEERSIDSSSGASDDPAEGIEENASDDDRTVMLDRHPEEPSATDAFTEPPPSSPSPTDAPLDAVKSSLPRYVSPPAEARDTRHIPDHEAGRRPRVKITVDTERITAKIWATVGDVVMPGNSFDPSGSKSGLKPPRAKETIAHLQSLAAQTPSLGSPSASSISFSSLSAVQTQPNQPTAQQILTAQMLLALLNSPPSYAMPLNKLKEVLNSAGGQGSTVTRPIYGCVAKRLLKIERGGGEQVVKFDI